MKPYPRLLPSSRRYLRDEWHPYGWRVSFKQTIQTKDGNRKRLYFSSLGTDRRTAILHALGGFLGH